LLVITTSPAASRSSMTRGATPRIEVPELSNCSSTSQTEMDSAFI
jgi:hypothetical protein